MYQAREALSDKDLSPLAGGTSSARTGARSARAYSLGFAAFACFWFSSADLGSFGSILVVFGCSCRFLTFFFFFADFGYIFDRYLAFFFSVSAPTGRFWLFLSNFASLRPISPLFGCFRLFLAHFSSFGPVLAAFSSFRPILAAFGWFRLFWAGFGRFWLF